MIPDSDWKTINFRVVSSAIKPDGSIVANLTTDDNSSVCFLLIGCRVISRGERSVLLETSAESRELLKGFWKKIFPMISYTMKVSTLGSGSTEEELEDKFSEIYVWLPSSSTTGNLTKGSTGVFFVEFHGLWKKSSECVATDIGWNLQLKHHRITSTEYSIE
jgi:hypothetical protein